MREPALTATPIPAHAPFTSGDVFAVCASRVPLTVRAVVTVKVAAPPIVSSAPLPTVTLLYVGEAPAAIVKF